MSIIDDIINESLDSDAKFLISTAAATKPDGTMERNSQRLKIMVGTLYRLHRADTPSAPELIKIETTSLTRLLAIMFSSHDEEAPSDKLDDAAKVILSGRLTKVQESKPLAQPYVDKILDKIKEKIKQRDVSPNR